MKFTRYDALRIISQLETRAVGEAYEKMRKQLLRNMPRTLRSELWFAVAVQSYSFVTTWEVCERFRDDLSTAGGKVS